MLKADKAGLFSSRAYAIVMEGLGSACFLSIGVTRPFAAYPETRTLSPGPCAWGSFIIQIDVLRSAPLRHASPAVGLLKKSVFNLSVDAMQPLLRPVGLLPISIDFCF